MTHSHAGSGVGPRLLPAASGPLQQLSFPPPSAPPLLPPSSRRLCPLQDDCDLREGGRASAAGATAGGGPHSVALQTLTKYASKAFCSFVVVPTVL